MISQKFKRLSYWISNCPFCLEGRLKLHLQFFNNEKWNKKVLARVGCIYCIYLDVYSVGRFISKDFVSCSGYVDDLYFLVKLGQVALIIFIIMAVCIILALIITCCFSLFKVYRVTHKEWEFRDDCTKSILSVSWFPASSNLFRSF